MDNGRSSVESAESEIILVTPAYEYADEIISFKNEMISSGSDLDGCGNIKNCSTAEE